MGKEGFRGGLQGIIAVFVKSPSRLWEVHTDRLVWNFGGCGCSKLHTQHRVAVVRSSYLMPETGDAETTATENHWLLQNALFFGGTVTPILEVNLELTDCRQER